MSITVILGSIKINIDNNTDEAKLCGFIDDLENQTIHGCELIVSIFVNAMYFHMYEFEYLACSKLTPKKWIINNILWSLTCDETKQDTDNIFNRLIKLLYPEL